MFADKYFRFFLGFALISTLSSACANSPIAEKLEKSFASDPQLKDNQNIFGTTEVSQREAKSVSQTKTPKDFPEKLKYPNAVLEKVNQESETEAVSTTWKSSDPSNIIASFYGDILPKDDWIVLEQSSDRQPSVLRAKRNDLQLRISIQPQSITNPQPNQPQTNTEIVIEYSKSGNFITSNNSKSNNSNNLQTSPGSANSISPNLPENSSSGSDSVKPANLDKIPEQLQNYVKDVMALGVVEQNPSQAKNNSSNSYQKLQLNKNITRAQYARWLVNVNNRIYSNVPAKQIRLASQSSKPAFTDVAQTHPDFSFIQGLADAGLIPSSLSGDSTQVLFQPNSPLTREQLILWKAPLDTRQALPQANINSVEKTWGFQDAGKVNPKALRAVLADFQNGEKSTIRRVFGYTTLFQPKRPVTNAEALAALWYFGTEGEGVSAKDALNLN